MPEKLSSRDPSLDVVRSLAIVLVLVIHTAGTGLSTVPGSPDFWGALVWGAPARPAVPLFFMCTGALMLCRDIPPRRLFGHNLLRIVCAMLAWAFAYRLAALLSHGLTLAGLWEAVKGTLLLQHEFHFYYLHILLLVTPSCRWPGCSSGTPPGGSWNTCCFCGSSPASSSPWLGISGPSTWCTRWTTGTR